MARWTAKFDGVFQRPRDVRPPKRFDRSIPFPRTDFLGLRGGMPPTSKKRAERDEICTTCLKNCGRDGFCAHLKSKKHQMAQRVWDWEEVPQSADPSYCVLCDLKTSGKMYFDTHVRDNPDHKFLVDVRTRSTNGKKKSPHQLVEALTCGGSYCPGTSDLHKPSQMPLLKAYKNPVLELGKEKAKKKKIFIMCDSSR